MSNRRRNIELKTHYNNTLTQPRRGTELKSVTFLALSGSVSEPSYSFVGSNNTGMFLSGGADAPYLSLVSSGSYGLRIDSTGRVAIGPRNDDATGWLDIRTEDSSTDAQELIVLREGSTNSQFVFYGDFAGSGAANNKLRIGSGISGWESNILTMIGDGRVGIGTSSPDSDLHIAGSGDAILTLEDTLGTYQTAIAEDAGTFSLQHRQKNGTFISNDYKIVKNASGANLHEWRIANSPKMLLNPTGLGIGTTSPGSILHIKTASPEIKYEDTDGGDVFNVGNNTGKFLVYNSTDGRTNLLIDGDGKVGIGTNSPAFPLEINSAGNASLNIHSTTSGNASVIELGNGGTGNRYAYIDFVGDDTYIDYGLRVIRNTSGANTTSQILHRGTGDLQLVCSEAADMSFWTSGAERVVIDSDGNVGIGITPADWKLEVNGDLFVRGSTICFSDSGTTNRDFFQYNDSGITGLNTRGGFGFYADTSLTTTLTAANACIGVEGIYNNGDIVQGTTETYYQNRLNFVASGGSYNTTITTGVAFTRIQPGGFARSYVMPLDLPKAGTLDQVDIWVTQSVGNTTTLYLYRQDFGASSTLITSTTFSHTTGTTVSLSSLAHTIDADSVYYLVIQGAAATYDIDVYGARANVQNPVINATR